MKSIEFATVMESAVRANIDNLSLTASPAISMLLDIMKSGQDEFHNLMMKASIAESHSALFPEMETEMLIGNEAAWKNASSGLKASDPPNPSDIAILWCVMSMLDKSLQFYKQASHNALQPQTRLFFSSAAELKAILHRRLDGIVRILSNQVWSAVGFPPGVLAKE